MASVIAVDLGGTSIRAALYPTETPQPRQRAKIPTHPEHGLSAVLERLTWAIEPLIAQCEGEVRIGVAAPGPLDTERGIILTAANLPGWSNVPLRQLLETRFECPVRLGNDANLAALGEWRFGAGQGSSLLLYLTISTGIGGGIVSHGKLFLGARGYAAELGHITVHPDGAPCGCGKSGHVEAVAAGPAIAGRALSRIEGGMTSTLGKLVEQGEALTAEQVGIAANDGDSLARAVIEETASIVGSYLADLLHIFNPDRVVLGGGVTRVGRLFFEALDRSMRARTMHEAYLDGLQVLPAALGDDAGLIGAMLLAREE